MTLHKHSGKTGRNITKSDYTHKHQGSTSPKKHGGHCYRCGRTGHFSRDMNCPARGKTCKKCGGSDHFSVVCRTQTTKNKTVNHVVENDGGACNDTDDSEPEYAFQISHEPEYAFRISSENDSSGMLEIALAEFH